MEKISVSSHRVKSRSKKVFSCQRVGGLSKISIPFFPSPQFISVTKKLLVDHGGIELLAIFNRLNAEVISVTQNPRKFVVVDLLDKEFFLCPGCKALYRRAGDGTYRAKSPWRDQMPLRGLTSKLRFLHLRNFFGYWKEDKSCPL